MQDTVLFSDFVVVDVVVVVDDVSTGRAAAEVEDDGGGAGADVDAQLVVPADVIDVVVVEGFTSVVVGDEEPSLSFCPFMLSGEVKGFW